ncbi:MAG: hypothetical protein U1A24_09910 [Cypionkella sp.]|uniref:hypothetical protein n=1 Tax=Cypionkella sp. TaxID=2811411 RepID=UPI002ABAF1C4|nr:hypothetical protein [Cypionkella sp.]MDZ4310851.1 hypothetical protein [Cypionkella sp.]
MKKAKVAEAQKLVVIPYYIWVDRPVFELGKEMALHNTEPQDCRTEARPVISRRDGGRGDPVQSAAASKDYFAHVEASDPHINRRPRPRHGLKTKLDQ